MHRHHILFGTEPSHHPPPLPHSPYNKKRTFELLEKRVESRFADRTIAFYPVAQFDTFAQIIRDSLTLPVESHAEASIWNQSIEVTLPSLSSLNMATHALLLRL